MASRRDTEDLRTVKLMFFGGCLALPFLWVVAAARYRKALYHADAPPELRQYVWLCAVGAAVATVAFVAWVAAYQLAFVNSAWGAALLVSPPSPFWWVNSPPAALA
jgi:hypothetical protein